MKPLNLPPLMGSVAIGYVRCSSENQEREGYSLAQQAAEIERFCADKGFSLIAIFREIESAKTASGRPVFQAAIQHLKADLSDVMVFTNWDRFARNIVDHEETRRELTRRGKRLIATFTRARIRPHSRLHRSKSGHT